jgi:hypothetical protein
MMLDNGYYCVFNLSKSKGRFTKSSIITISDKTEMEHLYNVKMFNKYCHTPLTEKSALKSK